MVSDSSSKMQLIASLMVAVIIAVGLIIAAVIISKGDYGRNMDSTAASQSVKVMDESMTMEMSLKMGGQEAMQKMSYNYGANVVIVDAPANISGSTAATIVVDYDRSVIFITVSDNQTKACVGSTLDDQMSTAIVNGMESNEHIIDVAKATLDSASYVQQGIIPSRYVSVSNGPTIHALCSGRVSYWTEKDASTSNTRRRKRAIGPINIMFCVWRFCFNIDIDFN